MSARAAEALEQAVPSAPSQPQRVTSTASVDRGKQRDLLGLLTVYLVLLFGLPAALIVGPLGAAGTPAQIFAVVIGVVWLAGQTRVRTFHIRSSAVNICMFLYLVATGLSVAAAIARPANSTETSVLYQSVLSALGLAAVYAAAASGVASVSRLETLVRRLALGGAVLATVGLVQWITKRAFVDLLEIPGLTLNSGVFGVGAREGFSRPAGTATHPIEFGLVIAMLLPLAIHFSLEDRKRGWLRRWYPTLIMASLIPLSLSRSAILAAAVGLVVLVPSWDVQRRIKALLLTLLGATIAFVTVPGLIGTLLGLFTGVANDPNVASRTDSYGLVGEFVARSPLFGRGPGTFLPEYRILDNQFLRLAIDSGLVGLAACVALLAAGIVVPLKVRRRTRDVRQRSLAQSLAAAVAAAACGFVTFDFLSFPMATGALFLILGIAAGQDRLMPMADPAESRVAMRQRTIWLGALTGLAIALTAVGASTLIEPARYLARTSIRLVLPDYAIDSNALSETSKGAVSTAGLLANIVDSGDAPRVVSSRLTLVDMGLESGSLARQPNRGGQWVSYYADPFIDLQAVAATQEEAVARITQLEADLQSALSDRESRLGVTDSSRIRLLSTSGTPAISYHSGNPTRAYAVLLGVAAALGVVLLSIRRGTRPGDQPPDVIRMTD